ncbi:MAG: ABC transporter substrate-binding protein [Tannerellaceae bacterium]|nr:ABC transporter substrate-binding protein [Tannerellaceae bacterium]
MFKHIFLTLIFFMAVSGCSSPFGKEQKNFVIAVLRGPSAAALAAWFENPPVINGKPTELRLVDSPEQMQALLVKQEPGLAVLPMINAANLYNKGIKYKLAGCPVWGSIYLVERKNGSPDNNRLYLFGKGATPDILTRYYLSRAGVSYELNYSYGTAREVFQGLLAKRIDRAVLSEPFLSMALKKDTTLQILADLNHPSTDSPGFPQTAIVYAAELAPDLEEIHFRLKEAADFTVNHPLEAIRILEKKEIFPPGMLTIESMERCKINYRTAGEAEKDIRDFLYLIWKYEPKAIGNRLPDPDFSNERP